MGPLDNQNDACFETPQKPAPSEVPNMLQTHTQASRRGSTPPRPVLQENGTSHSGVEL